MSARPKERFKQEIEINYEGGSEEGDEEQVSRDITAKKMSYQRKSKKRNSSKNQVAVQGLIDDNPFP